MASKRIRDLIKSVNLWFFDRLLFDAGQEKYTEKLNRCLDEELDNPKDCYQRLTASNDFCVEDMNKVFAGTYVFDAATLKRLFELGWDQHLYIYISLPFIEAAEFSGYDLDSVATGVITNSGYNCEKLLNLINMLVEDKPIKNQPFLDLVKTVFKALNIKASPESMARRAEDLWLDREEIKNTPPKLTIRRTAGKITIQSSPDDLIKRRSLRKEKSPSKKTD